jgi:epoxyqueuosine reductase
LLTSEDIVSETLGKEFHAYADRHDIDFLGFASPELFTFGQASKSYDPRKDLPEAKAIVVAGLSVYGAERELTDEPGNPRGKFGPGTTSAQPSSGYLEPLLVSFLEQRGFRAVYSDWLTMKAAAVRAGIAVYGKNCLTYTRKTGTYHRLAAYLTDAPLPVKNGPIEVSECGDCVACITACPTGALDTPYHLEYDKCIYNWLRGALPPRGERHKLGVYLHRCGHCQDVCPKNRNLVAKQELHFKPAGTTDRPELLRLLTEDDNYYHKIFSKNVLRDGIAKLRRNAALAAGNAGEQAAIPALVRTLSDPDTETRSAAAWALCQLGGKEAIRSLEEARGKETNASVLKEIKTSLEELAKKT